LTNKITMIEKELLDSKKTRFYLLNKFQIKLGEDYMHFVNSILKQDNTKPNVKDNKEGVIRIFELKHVYNKTTGKTLSTSRGYMNKSQKENTAGSSVQGTSSKVPASQVPASKVPLAPTDRRTTSMNRPPAAPMDRRASSMNRPPTAQRKYDFAASKPRRFLGDNKHDTSLNSFVSADIMSPKTETINPLQVKLGRPLLPKPQDYYQPPAKTRADTPRGRSQPRPEFAPILGLGTPLNSRKLELEPRGGPPSRQENGLNLNGENDVREGPPDRAMNSKTVEGRIKGPRLDNLRVVPNR
jgi:hypothetical protein